MNGRRVVLAPLAGLALCLAGPAASFAHGSGVRVDRSSGAMFRWWWPGADVDEGELTAEVDQIAGAGYNGGSIFADSLELKHAQAWTPGFLHPRRASPAASTRAGRRARAR